MNILIPEIYITNSPEETLLLGKKIGERLTRKDIVGLIGELGSGKTYITRGILSGLGCTENALSPSFVLLNIYKGRYPVYHFDFYRLDSIEEILQLGYEEYFYDDGVTIVEWADKMGELLPSNAIRIFLEITGVDRRRITIRSDTIRFRL